MTPSVDPGVIARLRGALSRPSESVERRRPTGFTALDAALLGGLPVGALTEVYMAAPGAGALEALLPCLIPESGKSVAWVHPSSSPYPPALARAGFDLSRWMLVRPETDDDHLWALEQCLRSPGCGAVVSHAGDLPDSVMRRLALAAEEGGATGFLVRPAALMPRPSPAAVRLLAEPVPSFVPERRRMRVTVLKCRGTPHTPQLVLEWNRETLDRDAFSLAADRTGLGGDADARESSVRTLHA